MELDNTFDLEQATFQVADLEEFHFPTGCFAMGLGERAKSAEAIRGEIVIPRLVEKGIGNFDTLNQKWDTIVQVPALDFIEAEDAEARILTRAWDMSTFDRIYVAGKSVVMMLSYTGEDDQEEYCIGL